MTTHYTDRVDGEMTVGAVIFKPPTPDTPGYLRNMRGALSLQAMRDDPEQGNTPEIVDRLLDFLLPYVVQPANRSAARDALLDASKTQFDAMLGAVAKANGASEAGAEQPAVPLAKSGSSATG